MTTEDLVREATVDAVVRRRPRTGRIPTGEPERRRARHAGRRRGSHDRGPRRGQPAHRRRTRRRQDDARGGDRGLDRHAAGAHPGQPRPAAVGHHRRLGLLGIFGCLGVPGRSGLRSRRAFRRAEPDPPAESGSPARGHGGAAGLRRRRVVAVARTASRAGDPEPDRSGRNVPARREPDGPLPSGYALGYPDEATETKLALAHGAQPSLSSLTPVCTPAGLASAQAAVAAVPVAPTVAGYAVAIVRASRDDPLIRLGASPRATIGLLAAARARAVIEGRSFVLPDDVKAVAVSVLAHRLVTDAGPVGAFEAGIAAVQAILERVPSPRP